MDRVRQMAAEIGVDSVTFRAPFLDEGHVSLSADDRARVAEWTPTRTDFNRYDPASQVYTAPRHHSRCGWHYMSSAINWDGTVAPCCTVFEKKHDFGTLSAAGSRYMDVVNNASFRAVRDSFAGRTTEPSGLVCESCPTPFLMDYHSHLNRQIAGYSLATALDLVRHPVRRFRTRRSTPPVLSAAEPVVVPIDDSPAPAVIPLRTV